MICMAVVTKSPLYEDGELVGIITLSCDAAVFNTSQTEGMNEEHTDGQSRFRGINFKKIQWNAQPQIISVPQIASSVSTLVLVYYFINHLYVIPVVCLDQINYLLISLYLTGFKSIGETWRVFKQ